MELGLGGLREEAGDAGPVSQISEKETLAQEKEALEQRLGEIKKMLSQI